MSTFPKGFFGEETFFEEQNQTMIAMNIVSFVKMMSDDPQCGISILDEPSKYEIFFSADELRTFKKCYGGTPNQAYIELINKIMRAASDIASIRALKNPTDILPDDLIAKFNELVEDTN